MTPALVTQGGGRSSAAAAWLVVGTLAFAFAQTQGPAMAPWILTLALAPLAEEIVFRLGLQEWLLRRGVAPRQANLWTALAFALAHVPTHAWPVSLATALPALALGALYSRTRKLAGCVLLHAAMNGAWLLWHL